MDIAPTPVRSAEQLAAALKEHQGLRLTRLACGELEMPCPPECARMGEPMPATADANQQFQFALELALS